MEPSALAFFESILQTPSPSGYESPVQDLVRQYVADFADEVTSDVHGNVMAARNPQAPLRVMLAGHCDQIALAVQHIDDDGYLYVVPIGGWDAQVLIGQRVTVWAATGPIAGVIGKKPIHLLSDEDRKKVPKIKDLWLDIGATGKEEVEKLVRVGDAVTVELAYRQLLNNRAASSAMDDKCGAWIVLEALRRIDPDKLRCAVYAVSTVQEEVGLRGAKTSAFGIDPHVGVAVDVTHATDCPTIDKKEEGDIRLDKGPVIYRGPNFSPLVVEQLVQSAEQNSVPFQMGASGRAPGTDANVMQLTRAGVATGLVSVPNRYMHSPVEVISLDDIDHCADLLARFVESIEPEADYRL